MRIATSTMYENQIASIDNLAAQQQQYGTELSSGKQLNVPSDDPMQIAQDLSVRTALAQENQASTNIQNASSQLTTVDGALSSLTSIMQSARSIAVQAGSAFTSPSQAQALAGQVDGLLQQAIGIANTKYSGKYVFAGTASSSQPAVTAVGQPVSSVTFNGNLQAPSEGLYGGESVNTSVTLQQAFNYGASNGSPDIFTTLIDLRDTLTSGTVTSESANRVNAANTAFTPGLTAPPSQPMNAAGILTTPLTADANGNVDVQITSQRAPTGVTITIPAADTVDQAVAAINAQTAATGVSASFDYKQQRMILSAPSGSFQIADVASAGAPSPGNFVEAFGLQSQANLQTDASRQLGDIDNAMQTMLSARASLGSTLQTLTALATSTSSRIAGDTQVQSGIEDADIAKVMTEFTQTQTALQAAYGTTTRLESKTLFDYLQ